MNAKPLANHYSELTPEERFRLTLAAVARGDEVEKERLTRAGRDIALSMSECAPFANAFNELAFLTFMEIQEETARLNDSEERAADAIHLFGTTKTEDGIEATAGADGKRSAWGQCRELVGIAGWMLQTKANGWKLFCERWNVPPMLVWEALPGFERLQRFLARAEKSAFRPARIVQWLNRDRAADKPEATEASILTAEKFANDLDATFQERSRRWGA